MKYTTISATGMHTQRVLFFKEDNVFTAPMKKLPYNGPVVVPSVGTILLFCGVNAGMRHILEPFTS